MAVGLFWSFGEQIPAAMVTVPHRNRKRARRDLLERRRRAARIEAMKENPAARA
jgi:hypothetical protein